MEYIATVLSSLALIGLVINIGEEKKMKFMFVLAFIPKLNIIIALLFLGYIILKHLASRYHMTINDDDCERFFK